MIRLAWRNIWRHPRRTGLTIAAIAFAASVLIFFIGLQLSSYEATIEATIETNSGAIQIQRRGYVSEPRMRDAFSLPASVKSAVASNQLVDETTKRASAFALLSSESQTFGAVLTGVLPKAEQRVSRIPSLLAEGRYLLAKDEQGIVLGKLLAGNLSVSLGEEVTILGQGYDGSLAATILPVVGILESGSPDLDRVIAHVPLGTLQDAFGLDDRIHALVIGVHAIPQIENLQKQLKRLLPAESPLDVLRWDELQPGVKQAIELDLLSAWFFYVALVVIVAFSVVNTFFMAVLERTREFCVMLSLGMQARSLSALVFLECAMLLSAGAVIGMLGGAAILTYFGSVGFSVPGMEEVAKTWNLPEAIYPRVTFRALFDGPAILLMISLIGVIFPALRPFSLVPKDGIRQL